MSKLEKFLINRNLLDVYVIRIKDEEWKSMKKVLCYVNPFSYFTITFSWRDTSEGYEFWSKINTEWHKCLRNKTL